MSLARSYKHREKEFIVVLFKMCQIVNGRVRLDDRGKQKKQEVKPCAYDMTN